MKRQIYLVNAMIVDANGTFNALSGYPKTFDSRNYGNDIDKAKRRAEGEFAEAWAPCASGMTGSSRPSRLKRLTDFSLTKSPADISRM